MNKIGVHFGYFNRNWNTDFVKQIDVIKRIGLDIMEVAPAPLLALTKIQRDEIAAAAKANNIELTFSVGLGLDQDLASEDETIRKNGIKFTTDAFKVMSEMGAKMYSGVDIAAWNKTFTEGIIDKSAAWERSILAVKEIMKSAEDMGITFAVEVVNRYESSLVNTAEEAIKYVDEVDSPNCKILLDTYHMNIEESSFSEAIHLAGDKLVNFHTGDNNRRCPGRGHIDFDEIFKALGDIHYTGRIVSEPFIATGGEVGNAVALWRDLEPDMSPEYRDKEAAYLLQYEKEKLAKYGLA